MARIRTYPTDENVNYSDKWIGSKGNGDTKNFSVLKVAEFLNEEAVVDSQTIRFRYVVEDREVDLERGDMYIDGETGDYLFSNLSILQLSNFAKQATPTGVVYDLSSFYDNPLVGSKVLITNVKNISQFAILSWDGYATGIETGFSEITLSVESSNGSLETNEEYFISLLADSSTARLGNDKNFVFTQSVPSNVWNITHNLDKFCSVSVVDSADSEVFGKVEYVNENEVIIRFERSFSGKAFCN